MLENESGPVVAWLHSRGVEGRRGRGEERLERTDASVASPRLLVQPPVVLTERGFSERALFFRFGNGSVTCGYSHF